jgi:hypothetical protein
MPNGQLPGFQMPRIPQQFQSLGQVQNQQSMGLLPTMQPPQMQQPQMQGQQIPSPYTQQPYTPQMPQMMAGQMDPWHQQKFDYRQQRQDWHQQRPTFQGGARPDDFQQQMQDWRGLRPDRHSFFGQP